MSLKNAQFTLECVGPLTLCYLRHSEMSYFPCDKEMLKGGSLTKYWVLCVF